jgi:putative resolvase
MYTPLCYFLLMRLSQYAKQMNVSYKTAFRWWKVGRLDAYQLDTDTIIVRDPLPETTTPKGIALYARVSTQGHKLTLIGKLSDSRRMQQVGAIK